MNTRILRYNVIVLTVMLLNTMACKSANEITSFDVDSLLNDCHHKVSDALASFADSIGNYDCSQAPRSIAPGDAMWSKRPVVAEEWCSGFWPGILWMDYMISGDENVAKAAEAYTNAIGKIVKSPVYDHDLGFLVMCSYGKGLLMNNNEEYKQIMLNAADSLSTLYNPNVGTICSWPRNKQMFGGHNTIMDNMINLELLFWAAKNGGGNNLYEIAINHADQTMKNGFRDDGTSCHVAVYNENSGKLIRTCTHQGYSDDSMWARGQAWAIYGYTMVYRETHDKKYLDFVQKVADAYLTHLPYDCVPYWDFNDPSIPKCSRDASAAAIVASALFELEGYVAPEIGDRYDHEAREMMRSLSSDAYWSSNTQAFLNHSTGNFPAGSEIDYSIVYADYYYLEALLRMRDIERKSNWIAKK
ncbi:MAG: glycoside hydrolase family 88 protein [Bacteroidaceae bacterium]|nr:glycoside hydrolase family 88 protein [Bacteroidaceae bacterium]